MNLMKQINRVRLGAQELRKRLPGHQPGIYYVVPEANWSIDWDGHYITKGVREQFDVKAQLISNPRWLSGQVLHYGSLWSAVGNIGAEHNQRNQVVVTVFHGNRGSGNEQMDAGINALLAAQDDIDMLVVSNTTMRERFMTWGVPASKIALIPLGVDLSVFAPMDAARKRVIRKGLGISEEVFCIGSFQKDGEGWGKGLAPKLVKGPDIFVAALAEISKEQPIHVLLTGPARGYVKRALDQLDIPFTHRMLDDYWEIANMYAALDAYMVSSREEGGPKGVLEALACGIPLISTRVGLAPDVIRHEENGLLVDIEDVDALKEQTRRVIDDRAFAEELAANGLASIQQYDWMRIAEHYYQQVYRELIA